MAIKKKRRNEEGTAGNFALRTPQTECFKDELILVGGYSRGYTTHGVRASAAASSPAAATPSRSAAKVPAGQTGLRVGTFSTSLVMTLTYNP
ncbi:hypothetical protein GHT07_02235 [Caenimonas koreensis DSM 17982]|uniref:Uncharacterized protein n=1 Tax=Caenimonas koreensis DSM 17982 TaxID=1121255 RepID=A0A844B6A7_9BURK|nr:hypothetical protein [Caenimonas koreensis]MRD46081.1 hypothetical protein [Caenimonas koreensis DSM 17982]